MVFTSNKHAVENFQHDCLFLLKGNAEKLERKLRQESSVELVTFRDIRRTLYTWARTAPDAELRPFTLPYFDTESIPRARRMAIQRLQSLDLQAAAR